MDEDPDRRRGVTSMSKDGGVNLTTDSTVADDSCEFGDAV